MAYRIYRTEIRKMIKVGITGGIGSGKTYICRLLELNGYAVFYSDAEAKKIQDTDPEVRAKIIDLFSEECYTANGLNRNFIAGIIFNNPDAKKKLEEIIHPKVTEAFNSWCEEKAKANHDMVFIESAILFESGFNKKVDKVIMIYADKETRILRSMKRDLTDRKSIEERIKNQICDQRKCELADYVIYNNPNDFINKQLTKIINELFFGERR